MEWVGLENFEIGWIVILKHLKNNFKLKSTIVIH
jgi:hypothetical protein